MKILDVHLLSRIGLYAIAGLFLVAFFAWLTLVVFRYNIPKTPPQVLVIEKLGPTLNDEANKLASTLQQRVKAYGVLSFVLVMIEILGSLFFAVTGINGQFEVSGGQANKVLVTPLVTTVFGVAILLAGSLKAGFQPNTRKVEYREREHALSNAINKLEAETALLNSTGSKDPPLWKPIADGFNEAIEAATVAVK